MANWSDTLQGAFGDIVSAGADVMKANAEAAGRTNNAPVTPSESGLQKWQPLVMLGVAGLAVVVFLLAMKRR